MTLQTARLASLVLSTAFGIVGMAVGINALIKYKEQKRELEGAVPAGATVNIDTGDILNTGYVVTVVSGLIALASFIFLIPAAIPTLARRTGSHRIQSFTLGFLTIWLFAALVAFTALFSNRSAKVTAFLGSLSIDQATIQQIVRSLGAHTKYSEIDYRTFHSLVGNSHYDSAVSAVRLPAILPWFTFLFGTTSSALLFAEARNTQRTTAYPVSSAGVDRQERSEKDQESVDQQEVSEQEKGKVANEEV